MLVFVFGFDGDGKWEARVDSFYYLNVQCITNMKILVNVRITNMKILISVYVVENMCYFLDIQILIMWLCAYY